MRWLMGDVGSRGGTVLKDRATVVNKESGSSASGKFQSCGSITRVLGTKHSGSVGHLS